MKKQILPVILIIFVIAIIFRIEIPVLTGVAESGSINSEDVAMVLLGIYVIVFVHGRPEVKIPEKTIFGYLLVIGVVILISTITADIRFGEVRAEAYLWILKWFQGVLLFLCLTIVLNRYHSTLVLNAVLSAGVVLVAVALYDSIFIGTFRTNVFFGNPNSLGIFITLIALLSLARAILSSSRTEQVGFLLLGVVSCFAVFATGSRSGMISLLAGLAALGILIKNSLSKREIIALFGVIGSGLLVAPLVVPDRTWRRLTSWIEVDGTAVRLSEGHAGESFRIRYQLLEYGMEKFAEQPLLGHGWYASPSRIGWLDIHYITILAELGLAGATLFGLLYLTLATRWIKFAKRSNNPFVFASSAWFIAVLVNGIAGNTPRIPRFLFIIILLYLTSYYLTADAHSNQEPA